jgi:integrase/recombinase XerD
MLTVYRRHLKATSAKPACPHSANRYYKKCRCPLWAEGTTPKGYLRQSLKSANWEDAEQICTLLSKGEDIKASITTIVDAADAFLKDKKVENVAAGTLRIATRRITEFTKWCTAEGYKSLAEIKLEDLRRFRGTWGVGPNTAANKQGTLFAFFRFCVDSDWILKNTAAKLSKIKVDAPETGYFTPDEFDRIVAATETMRGSKGPRVRALILLMRWSGLRISDAVGVSRDRITGENLFLYAMKNRKPVYAPLPPHVLEALSTMPALPKSNPKYYFWTGKSKIETSANVWRRSLMSVFEAAGIDKRCHPHEAAMS